MLSNVISSFVLRSVEDARAAVESILAFEEDGWDYKVVEVGNGKARIDVYDEEGELIARGF